MLLSISAITISLFLKDKRTVYVDTGKVFAEFKLTKELNTDLTQVMNARKNILDSIYQRLRLLTIEVKAEDGRKTEKVKELASLEESYYLKQQQFETDNKAATENYLAKVWNQLNQYIADYGSEKRCNYILGATGQGNIMFAQKEENITEDLIAYVNSRYDDKIKH